MSITGLHYRDREDLPPCKRSRGDSLFPDTLSSRTEKAYRRASSDRCQRGESSSLGKRSLKILNIQILDARSANDVICIAQDKWKEFDEVNMATLCYSLSRKPKDQEVEAFFKSSFFQDTIRRKILKNLPQFPGTSLFSLATAYTNLSIYDKALLERMSGVFKKNPELLLPLKSNQLAAILGFFEEFQWRDPDFLRVVAEKTREKRLAQFPLRALCQIATSFAKLEFSDPQLFKNIGDAVKTKIKTLDLRDYDIVHAYATLEIPHDPLFEALAPLVLQKLKNLRPRPMMRIGHSYALLYGERFKELCHSLVTATLKRSRLSDICVRTLIQLNYFFQWNLTSHLTPPVNADFSFFEEEIDACLHEIFPEEIIECNQPCCGYYPDFRIGNTIIEADGFSHFRSDGTPTDRTRMRNETYEKHGYKVVSISLEEWRKVKLEDRELFIMNRL